MLFFVKKNILRDFLFSELKTLEEFHVCHNPCSRLRGEERVARGILPYFSFLFFSSLLLSFFYLAPSFDFISPYPCCRLHSILRVI